jgi:general secretion pathway protein B
MSYILDALKKAERERDIAQVPTLSTVHDIRTRPHARMWVVPGIFVLCITGALWFFLFRSRPSSSKMEPRPAEAPGQAASRPEPDEIVSFTAPGALPSPPLPAESFKSHRPADVGQNPVNPMSMRPESIPVPRAKATPEPADVTERESSTISYPSALANENAAVSVARANAPDEPARKSTELRPTKQGGAQDRAKDVSPSADNTQQKSMSLREAVSKMTMSILFYSENKPERLVFIDGRKYVEGDMVEDRYLLESITPEGAVLSSQGERVVLRPGSK